MATLWFYASGNERKGPVSEAELQDLIRSGALKQNDLVWAEGMADWIPLSKSPLAPSGQEPATEPPPPPAFPPPPALLPSLPPPAAAQQQPVPLPQGMTGWMKFNGVMLVIEGAVYCLNCIGAVIGVPLILAGVGLYGGADSLQQAGGISPGLVPFIDKFKSFNTALGVYHIIMLALMLVGLLLLIIFFGAFLALINQSIKNGPPF